MKRTGRKRISLTHLISDGNWLILALLLLAGIGLAAFLAYALVFVNAVSLAVI